MEVNFVLFTARVRGPAGDAIPHSANCPLQPRGRRFSKSGEGSTTQEFNLPGNRATGQQDNTPSRQHANTRLARSHVGNSNRIGLL